MTQKETNVGTISEAVILMAGSGSRLRTNGEEVLKPLTPVLGRPLISYVFEALAKARVKLIHAVVGFESGLLERQIESWVPRSLEVRFLRNPDWEKQNGISLLAAANEVKPPFLLTMSDHLFEHAVLDALLDGVALDGLNVAVDRKLDSIFDLDDAMKLRLHGDRVVEIGKELTHYNAIDTGVFVCQAEIFTYLEAAKQNGDVSLADGVRAMAKDGKVRAVDIGDARWQDIDTLEMLRHAERLMQKGKRLN